MVFYEVFSHPELRRYKTTIFSKASLVQLICVTLTYLSPFLIAYFCGGFWIKEKLSTEQPVVQFQYRYLIIFETDSNIFISSSYDNLNQIYSSEYLPSVRTVYESDSNNDGSIDTLQANFLINGLDSTTTVKNVKILLVFNNSLSAFSKANFESIGFIETSNTLELSNDIKINAELQLFQRVKLQEKASYDEYNFLYLDQNNLDLETLQLDKILDTYYGRKYGTRFATNYIFWSRKTSNGFNINLNIHYPPFKVNYIPAFWEQFKYGWIQYVSVLIPFLFIFKTAKIFIFENQLVPTVVMLPAIKQKTL